MTLHFIVKCENLVDISTALLKDNKIYILIDEKEGELFLYKSQHTLKELFNFIQNDIHIILEPVKELTHNALEYLHNIVEFYDFSIAVKTQSEGERIYLKNSNFNLGLIDINYIELNPNIDIYNFLIITYHKTDYNKHIKYYKNFNIFFRGNINKDTLNFQRNYDLDITFIVHNNLLNN
jgi:hypothetical protein